MPRVNERFQLYISKYDWKYILQEHHLLSSLSIQLVTCNDQLCLQTYFGGLTWMVRHGAHKPKHFEAGKPVKTHRNQEWTARQRKERGNPENWLCKNTDFVLVGSAHYITTLIDYMKTAHLLKIPSPTY